MEGRPLRLVERPCPEPGSGEILVAVEVCGVCRTDLHVAEGDLAPRRAHVIPGHEVVGRVAGRANHPKDLERIVKEEATKFVRAPS